MAIPVKRVGREQSGIAGQMALWMLAFAVAGVTGHCRGWCGSTEWRVIADMDPAPGGIRLAFGQDRHCGVITVQALSRQNMGLDKPQYRIQRHAARPHDVRNFVDRLIGTPSTVVGLWDRALISVMTFPFARIGAVVAMWIEVYYPKGKRRWVRLHEKRGKRHEMPAHHALEAYLDSYIEAAGPRDGGEAPLFRSGVGRTGSLTEKPINRVMPGA